ARGLVDAPLQTLEAQRDRTLAEVLNVLDHGQGEVGISLHIVEELAVAFAIERAGLVGKPRGRLPLRPLATVDGQHGFVAVVHYQPVADGRGDTPRFGTDRFSGEVQRKRGSE